MDVQAMGKVGLTGMKGKAAHRAAPAVARATGLTPDQVEAIVGAIFLALVAWQFAKLAAQIIRAGRSGELKT
jgi:hypothetical protein